MLNNIKNPVCFKCHRHEEISGHSARQDYNKIHGEFLPDILDKVESDGTHNDFKMRYFDIYCNLTKCLADAIGAHFDLPPLPKLLN